MQKTPDEILYSITNEICELEIETEDARDLANIGYMAENANIGLEMNYGAQFRAILDRTLNACEKIK